MGYPNLVAGQIATADALNNPGPVTQTYVIKPADESVTSSSTLQDDDHLLLSVAANAIYRVETIIKYVSTSTTPGFQMAWSGPTGASLLWVPCGLGFGDTSSNDKIDMAARDITAASSLATPSSAGNVALPTGILTVGGTAGTLKFRWAQVSGNATATTVKAGSLLQLTRLSP